jgi:hypothetical protein
MNITKEIIDINGSKFEVYYLNINIMGIKSKIKLKLNPTEKAVVDLFIQQQLQNQSVKGVK